MSMTKEELVDQVATTVDLSKAQTEAVLTQCLQTIMDALQAGESVELRGFGRFQLRHHAARAGRNPRTGETIPIRSCTPSLRLISTAWKPSTIPSFQHRYEGILPWSLRSF